MSLSEEDFEVIVRAEVEVLKMMRQLNHPHLIKAVAYYVRGKSHYILFPWAERGNLREFWKFDSPKSDPQYLQWIFTQLCGLADAIDRLHYSHEERSTRHGDLKPENILCFDDPSKDADKDIPCILVIADVGLSRSHDKVTEFRKGATRTKSGTIMYEPPETDLQPEEPRTRRYDIWSLGCIYLEFVVWLLYGPKELNRFRKDLSIMGEDTKFYVIEDVANPQKQTARLSNGVEKWVEWIKKDPRCPKKTAIRSLVDLVVERMLITDVGPVPLPRRTSSFLDINVPTSPLNTPIPSLILRAPTRVNDFELPKNLLSQSRATAAETNSKMATILQEAILVPNGTGWMSLDAPLQEGPGQYSSQLDTTDRREQQVR
jgi:serine/threonine protein kinase